MNSYIHKGTSSSPEIYLSPDENRFVLSGRSAPEDVRSTYYPVLEWMDKYVTEVSVNNPYHHKNPLLFKFDFDYFNSSSAKFLYDIIFRLKELMNTGVPVEVEWYYDTEDTDLHDAGEDLAILLEMQFRYCPKPQTSK
ncbi:MAG: DUF1987 domain-containing protein [Bacteroidales bacterium]|jgi:hypothetical protein|nr:DUF1987 domain-containing protein [Bacteroidales bacterium]